jgi:hypothetical protein
LSTTSAASGRSRSWRLLIASAAFGIACGRSDDAGRARAAPATPPAPLATSSVFTPAHPTVAEAVRDFFGLRRPVEQPFPFPHNVHVANKLACTDYCHESAAIGPVAGLPSVTICLTCHDSIATDRPAIQRVAEYWTRGVDIPWQRVNRYSPRAHVRFNHAPHVRAGVECATCHGNVAEWTVARPAVDLTMGFCVDCHRAKDASNDCMTCHY